MRGILRSVLVLALAVGAGIFAGTARAQEGSIEGSVKDPSGAAVVKAAVEITNPVSSYSRSVTTGADGSFRFTNVPFNPYHLVVTAAGFSGYTQDVDVRSTVPNTVEISLKIATTSSTVTVESNGGDLIETDSTAHTDIDRGLFDKLPLESQSSSLSSLVTLASPGISADSNGLFHGFGDHASNSFSVDGQPITDQQSKVFSNQIPVDAVQSMEVIRGRAAGRIWRQDQRGDRGDHALRPGRHAAPRRSDGFLRHLRHRRTAASISLTAERTWGNFISASGLNTGRFLDRPGIRGDARPGQRGRTSSTASITSRRSTTRST